ncbi:MAG: hypothetical protein V1816_05245 [Pseudomonadota bacterium]
MTSRRRTLADMVAAAEFPDEPRRDQGLWVSCISGAMPAADLEKLLTQTGFSGVRVETDEAGRELMKGWGKGRGLENYAAPGWVEAFKPLAEQGPPGGVKTTSRWQNFGF